MAKFEIVSAEKPYYTVKVSFGDQEFTQQIVSDKTGKALEAQIQNYADEYESAWVVPEVEDPT